MEGKHVNGRETCETRICTIFFLSASSQGNSPKNACTSMRLFNGEELQGYLVLLISFLTSITEPRDSPKGAFLSLDLPLSAMQLHSGFQCLLI